MAISLKTPLVLVNDEDLVRVSRDNPGYRFEREEDGRVIGSPTHTKGGAISLEAVTREVVRRGVAPADLILAFDAMIDA